MRFINRRRSLMIALLLAFGGNVLAIEIAVSDPEIRTAYRRQVSPAIASDGENFFAAWVDTRSGPDAGARIFGARLRPDGSFLDPTGFAISEIAEEPNGVREPAVVWTGSEYVVIWGENFWKIYARRISRDGKLIDSRPVKIAHEFLGPLTAVTTGRTILVRSG